MFRRTIQRGYLLIILAVFIFTLCILGNSTSQTLTPQKNYEQVKTNFEKIVAAAKKEGKITWYHGFPAALREAVESAWKKKYPEIKLEGISGRAAEFTARIQAEQRSKAHVVDVLTFPPSVIWALKKEGLVTKYEPKRILPTLNDPDAKWMMDIIVDPEGYYFDGLRMSYASVAINTNLVPPDKEPNLWKDLTNPYWKGPNKMVFRDPTQPGLAGSWLVIFTRVLGSDYIRAVAAQKPTAVVMDSAEALKLVARGEYALMMPGEFADVGKMPAGTPLKVLRLKEGLLGSSTGFVVIKNAPDPNAALVFAEFLLSMEGQTVIASAGEGIARAGIPLPFPETQNISGVKILMATEEEILNKAPSLWKEAKPWFGR